MKLTILLVLVTVLGFSCKKDDNEVEKEKERISVPCGEEVRANAENFSSVESDNFIITDASVSGDCLTLTLGLGSACSDPEIDVFHSISEAAVFPPQHLLKVAIKYGTGCAMPGIKTFKFDLYPIRQKNTNRISLSISGSEGYYKTLEYIY